MRKKNVTIWAEIALSQSELGPDRSSQSELGPDWASQSEIGPDRVGERQPIRNWAKKYSKTLGPIWPKMTSLYIGANQIGPASRTNQNTPNLSTIRLC